MASTLYPFQEERLTGSVGSSGSLLKSSLEGIVPVLRDSLIPFNPFPEGVPVPWDASISLLSKVMPTIQLADKSVNQPISCLTGGWTSHLIEWLLVNRFTGQFGN